MPKAILAIRTYPATLLLALFLFLATLVVTTGSLGKVGTGGGDSGDGGSGIGGTGKSGEFGGSGFGGTGGPSPFFTSVEDDDHTAEPAVLNSVEPGLPATSIELVADTQESPTPVVEDSTFGSAIEEVIEQHPLASESQIILASDSPESDTTQSVTPTESAQLIQSPVIQSPALQVVEAVQVEPAAANEQIQVPEAEPSVTPETPYSTIVDNTTDSEPAPAADALQHVAETLPVRLETTPESIDPEIDRRSLPDRIQRPELPPFQRIRPVERAGIMPPRVQPMRI